MPRAVGERAAQGKNERVGGRVSLLMTLEHLLHARPPGRPYWLAGRTAHPRARLLVREETDSAAQRGSCSLPGESEGGKMGGRQGESREETMRTEDEFPEGAEVRLRVPEPGATPELTVTLGSGTFEPANPKSGKDRLGAKG